MSILNSGISASVLSKSPVHVNASSIKRPKLNWHCSVKGKVWRSECGMVIENNSSLTHGIPVRVFFVFKNQSDYDAGRLATEAKNLGTAKLLAEDLL